MVYGRMYPPGTNASILDIANSVCVMEMKTYKHLFGTHVELLVKWKFVPTKIKPQYSVFTSSKLILAVFTHNYMYIYIQFSVDC